MRGAPLEDQKMGGPLEGERRRRDRGAPLKEQEMGGGVTGGPVAPAGGPRDGGGTGGRRKAKR